MNISSDFNRCSWKIILKKSSESFKNFVQFRILMKLFLKCNVSSYHIINYISHKYASSQKFLILFERSFRKGNDDFPCRFRRKTVVGMDHKATGNVGYLDSYLVQFCT